MRGIKGFVLTSSNLFVATNLKLEKLSDIASFKKHYENLKVRIVDSEAQKCDKFLYTFLHGQPR